MDFDGWKRRPDQVSLSALLESVEPRVYRICRRIVRDDHEAEEAKQEVLLEISSGLDSVVDGAHFERWVGKIAFRTALDRRRMRLRRIAREHESAGRTPNGAAHDDALHESMSRLDDEDRDLLIERYFDRRTLREMGLRRGISAVAVRKRIAGAQDRLKRKLGGVFPIVFWKGAVTVGVAAMKTKAAAGLAIIVLPLLLIGGGVFVAAAKRHGAPVEKPLAERNRLDAHMSQGGDSSLNRRPLKGRKSSQTPDKTAIAGQSPAWSRFLELIDRIAWMQSKIRDLLVTSRNSLTEEEGRRLQVEAKGLQDQVKSDFEELRLVTLQQPGGTIEFIRSWRRHVLMGEIQWLVVKGVDSEVDSEQSLGGPLFVQFLTMAEGDSQDRIVFSDLVSRLALANRHAGQACIALLNDSDPEVQLSANRALSRQASLGNLKETLTAQSAVLLSVAMSSSNPQLQTEVLGTLAYVGAPETDDAVLRLFESGQTSSDMDRMWHAMLLVAPRAAERDGARLKTALNRALSLPLENKQCWQVAYLSLAFPPAECAQILSQVAARVASDPAMAESLRGLIQSVENGGIEKLRSGMHWHRHSRPLGHSTSPSH